MPLIPGQIVHGRYRVIALLSQGGMGAVYEVMDNTLNVRCALKEMIPYTGTPGSALPQLREQFQQEARLLAGLRHPNLPRVSDHFEEDGNAYLVMDFVYGRRLDEVITQEGGLTEEETLGWARQLLEALAHCHEQGVIHRDVKPQNVIITWQGQAVLVDFGLAKLVDPEDPHTRTVMRGLGTPEYAPPEQYDAKKGGTDPRTDIYSLGATLYHALVGTPPPTATERVVDPEVLVPVRRRRNDVSEVTDRVLMKAMALQPPYRFQSAAEMYRALFGSPLPTKVKTGSTVPSGSDTNLLSKPPRSKVLLPWMGRGGLRIDRRLGAGLLAVGLVFLVTALSLVAGRANGGSVPTATATPTVRATMTSTPTPTASPTSTATPTASPTSRPPTRQPTKTQPAEIPLDLDVRPPVASPTSTRVFLPSPTPTSVPTNTPEPARPRPRPSETPKQPTPVVSPETPVPSPVPPTRTPRGTPAAPSTGTLESQ
jgi:serine/threonine protein kinase